MTRGRRSPCGPISRVRRANRSVRSNRVRAEGTAPVHRAASQVNLMAIEIPRYQSATPLGGESVIGFSGDVETHINWSAQATDDPPDTVLAFYEQRLGEANERKGQQ